MSSTTPVYAQFLAALAPLVKGLPLELKDQGSFVRIATPNGHKTYVAKHARVR